MPDLRRPGLRQAVSELTCRELVLGGKRVDRRDPRLAELRGPLLLAGLLGPAQALPAGRSWRAGRGRRSGVAAASPTRRSVSAARVARGTRTDNQRIRRIPIPGTWSLYQQLRPHPTCTATAPRHFSRRRFAPQSAPRAARFARRHVPRLQPGESASRHPGGRQRAGNMALRPGGAPGG